MRLRITTDDVPERDRFELWSQTVFSTLAISVQPIQTAGVPFHACFTARSSGPLLNCSFQSDGFHATRQGRELAYRQWHGYRVYRESSPGVRFRIGGQEVVTAAGDLLVVDADAPFEARPAEGYADESWLLLKSLIEPHLPLSRRPLVTRLSGRSGVGALAESYLDALSRNWDSIPEHGMGRVADTLARLIGIACGSAAEQQPEAVRAGRLAEAMRYIDLHLADRDLTPAAAAAALHIAVRTLHLAFESSGASFSRTVLRRRLQECRAALLVDPSRPVTDIAFAWGFSTLSSFYRAFQAEFGMAPGDLRRG